MPLKLPRAVFTPGNDCCMAVMKAVPFKRCCCVMGSEEEADGAADTPLAWPAGNWSGLPAEKAPDIMGPFEDALAKLFVIVPLRGW